MQCFIILQSVIIFSHFLSVSLSASLLSVFILLSLYYFRCFLLHLWMPQHCSLSWVSILFPGGQSGYIPLISPGISASVINTIPLLLDTPLDILHPYFMTFILQSFRCAMFQTVSSNSAALS